MAIAHSWSVAPPNFAPPILASNRWASNSHLIADVARLGYLGMDLVTLDPTYGKGNWWNLFRPKILVGHDIKIDGVDFRDLPYYDGAFEAVAFDPDYRLNGTPDPTFDERYGTDVRKRWQDRMQDMADGFVECARVLETAGPGTLVAKCQDQVCSGKLRWQTTMYLDLARSLGLVPVDRFDMTDTGRPQPEGRKQKTAYYRPSTLLVFRKPQPRKRSASFGDPTYRYDL